MSLFWTLYLTTTILWNFFSPSVSISSFYLVSASIACFLAVPQIHSAVHLLAMTLDSKRSSS